MAAAAMDSLTLILLCNGTGADATSYKPNRDDSQWWNRRDSLVRCVTSSLFSSNASSTSLCLIFDQDWSRLHMEYTGAYREDGMEEFIPTEKNVVSLWKAAVSQPHQSVCRHGLSCRLVLDETQTRSASTLPSSMDNKREVLTYLQKHCSIEFLRMHGLNANSDVVLRKTNKKKLIQTWRQWESEQSPSSNNNSITKSKDKSLETIFNNLLKPDLVQQQVIAGILHESSEHELPCFQPLEPLKPSKSSSTKICLFLGAVRDMHSSENQLLQKCCIRTNTPIVAVRLGHVAEFTSKILTVATFHHANGKLEPAMRLLLRQSDMKVGQKRQEHPQKSVALKLHVFLAVDIPSTELSSDLAKRSPELWTVVRATVCTLWRSRLASGASDTISSPLLNTLSLIFSDGIALTLCQADLVNSLAEKHQAAPSEHQILRAIEDQLASTSSEYKSIDLTVTSALVDCDACLYHSEKDSTNSLESLYYSCDRDTTKSGKVCMLLGQRTICRSIRKRFKEASIIVIPLGISTHERRDHEATSIVMVQHLLYQNRLFAALRHNKRKRRKKK